MSYLPDSIDVVRREKMKELNYRVDTCKTFYEKSLRGFFFVRVLWTGLSCGITLYEWGNWMANGDGSEESGWVRYQG